jgi:hypothetical protein
VQRISGHKTLAMVLRYTHVHGRHIDDAIRAIGRTLPKHAATTIIPKLHQGAANQDISKAAGRPKLRAI